MAHAWAVPIGIAGAALLAIFGVVSESTAFVSVVGFIIVRFLLGLGEAGNFPASIKTVAEWFPKKERALATGIFNSGTNVGALATPLVVPWIVYTYGWYEAFIVTGVIGFLWLAVWLVIYRKPEDHPRLSKEELAYIQSDPVEPAVKIPWKRLFPHRQTWAFATGKFLTDPIWWVYLFWIPDFLQRQHGLDIKTFGPPIAVIYIIADIGSIGGGYISSRLIKNGWTINSARVGDARSGAGTWSGPVAPARTSWRRLGPRACALGRFTRPNVGGWAVASRTRITYWLRRFSRAWSRTCCRNRAL
jgi:ACS family hexuronate transporter-like MFS transporter